MQIKKLLTRAIANIPVRIASGPNKGMKWSLATGRRYRKGEFETERVQFIASVIEPLDCFWDIGAHRGYVTLIAAKRAEQVFAFEPAAMNLWFLRKHIEWNKLRNTVVTPAAIGDKDGKSRFGGGKSLCGRLGEGNEMVNVCSISSLISSGEAMRPTFIKVDVEGGEVGVLKGAGEHLRSPDLLLLVATHSLELHEACLSILSEFGLRIVESGKVQVARRNGWDAVEDPEILAIGRDRRVQEADIQFFVDKC